MFYLTKENMKAISEHLSMFPYTNSYWAALDINGDDIYCVYCPSHEYPHLVINHSIDLTHCRMGVERTNLVMSVDVYGYFPISSQTPELHPKLISYQQQFMDSWYSRYQQIACEWVKSLYPDGEAEYANQKVVDRLVSICNQVSLRGDDYYEQFLNNHDVKGIKIKKDGSEYLIQHSDGVTFESILTKGCVNNIDIYDFVKERYPNELSDFTTYTHMLTLV